jgi:hypothetical protein
MNRLILPAVLCHLLLLAGGASAQTTHPGLVTTVSGLPSCDATRDGLLVAVTDATSRSSLGAGGGSTVTLAQCDNGTGWLAVPDGAGGVPRTAATDCTAETGGTSGELCVELDDDTLYSCQPSAGDCDTAGEWVLTGDGGGGGSLQVDESDGAPSVSSVTEINFDQADGFEVTDDTGGSVTIALGTVPAATTAAALTDGDKGDFSCTSGTCTVDADAVALGTDTTGDYVSSATASQGLTVTGTEGASVGVQDCAANQILKRNAGDTGWECAADSTGGTPSFDAVTSGTNTTAAMVVGSGASLRSSAGVLGVPNGTATPGTCTEGDTFWDTDDDTFYLCSATDTWTASAGGGETWVAVDTSGNDNSGDPGWDHGVDGTTAFPIDFVGLSGASEIQVYISQVSTSASGVLVVRLSDDNGTSYYDTDGEYFWISTSGTRSNKNNIAEHANNATAARDLYAHIYSTGIDGTIKTSLHSGAVTPYMLHPSTSTSPITALRVTNHNGGNATGGQIWVLVKRQ